MAKLVAFSGGREWVKKEDESFRDYMHRTYDLLDKLIEKSDDLPEGKIRGAIISFPVGDGKAFYMVEKARPLEVSCIPVGDCYQVDPIMIEGLRPIHVRHKLESAKALNQIFGRN